MHISKTRAVSATVGIMMLLGAGPALACAHSPGGGNPTGAHRVTICHVDGQGRYHKITVDRHAVPAHLAHGDKLPNANGDCPAGQTDNGGDNGGCGCDDNGGYPGSGSTVSGNDTSSSAY